jgi:hypothetical protein
MMLRESDFDNDTWEGREKLSAESIDKRHSQGLHGRQTPNRPVLGAAMGTADESGAKGFAVSRGRKRWWPSSTLSVSVGCSRNLRSARPRNTGHVKQSTYRRECWGLSGAFTPCFVGVRHAFGIEPNLVGCTSRRINSD